MTAAATGATKRKSASGLTFFEHVNVAFDQAAKYTDHDPTLLEQVKQVNAVYRVSFPLRRDDGTIEVIDESSGPSRKNTVTSGAPRLSMRRESSASRT